jgi:flagellar biogenesis protein FliO
MLKRWNALCAWAALIILSVGAANVCAAQNVVEANGAASLPAELISIIPDFQSDGKEGAAAPSLKKEESAESAARASQSTASANEHRPLGPPPKAVQLKGELSGISADDGFLEKIDPRSNDITKVVGALAIVVGLMLLLRVFLRKSGGFLTGGGRPSGVVEILAKYPVGRAQNIVLLKVARRVVLLHQSGSSMTTLSEMTDPDEVAGLLSRLEAGSTERDAERFRRTLTQFMAEHEAPVEKAARVRRPQMPLPENEIVDLTRGRRGFAGMLGRRSGA